MPIDLSNYPSPHSLGNKLARVLWGIVWLLLYRPSPRPLHAWRRFLLRLFGASIGRKSHPYPGARIWGPWNLELGDYSSISDFVDCYCVAPVRIGSNVAISQYTYLCTASHDYEDPLMPLRTAPIIIGDGVWICADSFIAPGVTVGEGAVVGARSTVLRDVEPWSIVAGHPAKFIKKRQLRGVSA